MSKQSPCMGSPSSPALVVSITVMRNMLAGCQIIVGKGLSEDEIGQAEAVAIAELLEETGGSGSAALRSTSRSIEAACEAFFGEPGWRHIISLGGRAADNHRASMARAIAAREKAKTIDSAACPPHPSLQSKEIRRTR